MIIDLINVNSTRGSIFLFKLIVCGKTAFLRIIEKVNNCNLAVLPSLNLIIFTLTDGNAKLPSNESCAQRYVNKTNSTTS